MHSNRKAFNSKGFVCKGLLREYAILIFTERLMRSALTYKMRFRIQFCCLRDEKRSLLSKGGSTSTD